MLTETIKSEILTAVNTLPNSLIEACCEFYNKECKWSDNHFANVNDQSVFAYKAAMVNLYHQGNYHWTCSAAEWMKAYYFQTKGRDHNLAVMVIYPNN